MEDTRVTSIDELRVTRVDVMAVLIMDKALRSIRGLCTEGYYGPDNHRCDLEAKRIAAEALEAVEPILAPWRSA